MFKTQINQYDRSAIIGLTKNGATLPEINAITGYSEILIVRVTASYKEEVQFNEKAKLIKAKALLFRMTN